MDLLELLPSVQAFLNQSEGLAIPGWDPVQPFDVRPLAQGEYNLNYKIGQNGQEWVLRVNMGSQIQRADQIAYEYNALRLLQTSGVTPRPYFVDDSRARIPYGVLGMEYLPGEALDYRRDLDAAARLFARIHSVRVAHANRLIHEARPLTMTYEECARLLPVYLDSDLAAPELRDYFIELLAWAAEARLQEAYFLADPWPCIINTEVNSGNFIVNRDRGTLHLVDWEKPLWGDPSQDLSHFSVPTTTLWKTDYRMGVADRRAFLDAYRAAIFDTHLRDTIIERVRLRDPFNCLRGISWSAMAWVTYQTGGHTVRNADTFRKVTAYLNLDFVRGLFDSYLRQS